MRMTDKTVWSLIPAFNEGKTIGEVIEGTRRYCENIVVVDDGSGDDTRKVAQRTGVIVLSHDRNLGKGAALKTGFRWLLDRDCSAVLTLDADGQHDPEEIPKFLQFAEKNREGGIIIGARSINRKKMPLYRAVPNRIGELFISVAARRHITDTQSGFRLYSREVLERVECDSKGFDFETEILIKASKRGMHIVDVPIKTIYQKNYKTHFRPITDFYRISIVVIRNLL